jgi:preprotein translocase subunit YajC
MAGGAGGQHGRDWTLCHNRAPQPAGLPAPQRNDMDFFITPAWAQAAPGTTAGTLGTILPLVLIFVVFYFMLIRPQTKRAKEHREMVAKLAAGDEVVTNGGVLGRISEVDESFVTLQVSAGTAIRVQKVQIAQLMPKGTFKPV